MAGDAKKQPKKSGELLRDFGHIALIIGGLIVGAEVIGDL